VSARLAGKVALVTGAARGIGASIANAFAQEGAAVALADRRDDLGAEVAAEIRERGGRALYVHLDITSEEDWRSAVVQTGEELGDPNVLVNNAGAIRVKPFRETSRQDLSKLLETNVVGAFLGMQAVIDSIDPLRGRLDRQFFVRAGARGSRRDVGVHGFEVRRARFVEDRCDRTRSAWDPSQYGRSWPDEDEDD